MLSRCGSRGAHNIRPFVKLCGADFGEGEGGGAADGAEGGSEVFESGEVGAAIGFGQSEEIGDGGEARVAEVLDNVAVGKALEVLDILRLVWAVVWVVDYADEFGQGDETEDGCGGEHLR